MCLGIFISSSLFLASFSISESPEREVVEVKIKGLYPNQAIQAARYEERY